MNDETMKAGYSSTKKLKVAQSTEEVLSPQAIATVTAGLQPMTEVEALATELLTIEAELLKVDLTPMLTRKEELKKALQSIALETCDPDQPFIIDVEAGRVEFSKQPMQTTITDKDGLLTAVMTSVGPEAVTKLIKITLTDAKKYLSENELANYTTTELGKTRTCKAILPKKP